MELFSFLLSCISLLYLLQYSPSKFDIPPPPRRARTIGFFAGRRKKKTSYRNWEQSLRPSPREFNETLEASCQAQILRKQVDQRRRREDKSQIAKRLHNRQFLEKRSEVCGGAGAFIKVPSNRKRDFVEISGEWFGWRTYGNLGAE